MQQICRRKSCRTGTSIKLLYNFIEIALRHGCSPVSLLHIFRKPFPRGTSGGLLLILFFFCQDLLFQMCIWSPVKRLWWTIFAKTVNGVFTKKLRRRCLTKFFRSLETHQCISDQMKILKDHCAQTYICWLFFSIDILHCTYIFWVSSILTNTVNKNLSFRLASIIVT